MVLLKVVQDNDLGNEFDQGGTVPDKVTIRVDNKYIIRDGTNNDAVSLDLAALITDTVNATTIAAACGAPTAPPTNPTTNAVWLKEVGAGAQATLSSVWDIAGAAWRKVGGVLSDDDCDTYISVEDTADSDRYYGHVDGQEALTVDVTETHLGTNSTTSYQAATNKVVIGHEASNGRDASDLAAVDLGWGAGSSADGDNQINIGRLAGQRNVGSGNVNIGYLAGFGSTSGGTFALGQQAGYEFDTNNSMLIGFAAGFRASGSDDIFIGSQSGFTAGPSTRSIAIGRRSAFAIANFLNSVAIGTQSAENADLVNTTSVGYLSSTGGSKAANTVVTGYNAFASSTEANQAVIIGAQAANQSNTLGQSVFIGYLSHSNSVDATRTIKIGTESGRFSGGDCDTWIGDRSGYFTGATRSTFLGCNSGDTTNGYLNTFIGNETGTDAASSSTLSLNLVAGQSTINAPSHGFNFTAQSGYVSVQVTNGGTSGYSNSTRLLLRVVDGNTLEIASPTLPTGTSAVTVDVPLISFNSTAVGANAKVDRSNQVRIGDNNVVEVKTAASLFAFGQLPSYATHADAATGLPGSGYLYKLNGDTAVHQVP